MPYLVTSIHYLFSAYTFLLMARIIGSWIPSLAGTKFMQLVALCTDPYLQIFRKVIPPLGGLDLSPLLAFFALQIVENFLVRMALSL